MRSIFAFLLLACVGCRSALAADWTPRAFPRGPNAEITALRAVGDVLYAAGAFGAFGPYAHPGVMRLEGGVWRPVGNGFRGRVAGLAVDGRGYLYAAGDFPGADGDYGLIVWNGTQWSYPPDAKGLKGWGPIAAAGDAAYVVFESKPKEVYRCDGSALTSLQAQADGFIEALATTANDLIAGGEFTSIGGVAGNHVARFRGLWEPMSDGLAISVQSLAVVDGDLIAGGRTGDATAAGHPGVARWDGDRWVMLGKQPSDRGYIMAVGGGQGRIYAGGYMYPDEQDPENVGPGLSEWDGSDWKRIDDHVINRETQALAMVGETLWAGGRFYDPAAPYLAQWDGKTWRRAISWPSQAPDGNIALFASGGGRLFAAGVFHTGPADSGSILAEWNGNGWTGLGSPPVPGDAPGPPQILSLEVHAGQVYLCVSFADNGPFLLWRWSGGAWQSINNGEPIQALRSAPDGLYAGGRFTGIGNVAARHIARWDGAAWHAVGTGLDFPVTALEWDGTALFAAEADMSNASGIPSQVSRFSGGQWSVVGATASAPVFNGTIRKLIANDGRLWAGGEFQGNGLFLARGVAVWDGTAWRGTGDGLAGVHSLAVSPAGDVYAAGKFQQPSPGAARWTGSAWEAMGEGLGSDVDIPSATSAAWFGDDLFVAGYFDFAGGKPSAGMARWAPRSEELGLRPRPVVRTRSERPAWHLLADGRLVFADPARAALGFDALGRLRILPASGFGARR